MSILELLITVPIGSPVIHAGLELFVTMNHQAMWQDQITEARQSGCAILRVPALRLRMAGFGIPRVLYLSGGTESQSTAQNG
jgi:Tfp pilus assembly protein PilW